MILEGFSNPGDFLILSSMGHPCKVSIKCPHCPENVHWVCEVYDFVLCLLWWSLRQERWQRECWYSLETVLERATQVYFTAQLLLQTLTSTGTRLWSFLVVFSQFDSGLSQNLIFLSVVEVSHRNLMWSWFLGLVYRSVITEMARNEDKRWLGLLPPPQGHCLWRKQLSCLGTMWPRCICSKVPVIC